MGGKLIQSNHHSKVPVIDFADVHDPAKRASICAQIAQACETLGCFQIINSGVPVKVLEEAFAVRRDFHDLPEDEKMKLAPELGSRRPLVPTFQLGYKHRPVGQGLENGLSTLTSRHYHMEDDHEELKRSYTSGSPTVGDIDPSFNWWPSNPADYRSKVKRLTAELGVLGDTLLDLFSQSLGIPPTYLREVHHNNTAVPRYLGLHRCSKVNKTEQNANKTIITPHRDVSIFTILGQSDDAYGLQIKPDEEWISVVPERGTVVVNVGEILQAWSNGRYRSVLHRVATNKERDRYSFAYFLYPAPGPDADLIVKPIPMLITEENPPTYKPFSYLEFFMNKLLKESLIVG